ncbi:6475_t:CDS:2, partial [Racocetra fulgida]
GFDITEVSNLISKAKTLNSYIGGKDKYRESLRELQAELNPQHQVNPLSSDTRTHWNGTKLSDLLLSTEEWNSIDELAKLLHPFTQATEYIGGSQYPTLGMMIPTLIKLSRHLREFYPAITSQTVKACCNKINQSMLSRWSEPSFHSLIAAFLDLRFKQMNYVTASKKRETIAHLYSSFDTQGRSTFIQELQPLNTNSSSFFSSFYDDDYVIQNELKNISLIEKE